MSLNIYSHPDFDDHEMVIYCTDKASGMRAFIAVHDTTLGPGLGGCRMKAYESEQDALSDALRLSRGMTYKYAISGQDYGGAKAVIIDNRDEATRSERILAFARCLERLGGLYVTGEDAGIETADVRLMRTATRHVRELPMDDAGEIALCTAVGVFHGIKAGLEFAGLPGIKGSVVAVEGLGKVGMRLCQLIHENGGQLIVYDIDEARIASARDRFGAVVAEAGTIHAVEADVYAPCALGAVLNPGTIPQLRAAVVAGAANNQLSDPDQDAKLAARNIVYCPDFVVNAGGVLCVPEKGIPFDLDSALGRARNIQNVTAKVLEHARDHGITPGRAADVIALARLTKANGPREA
ncbi:leucine dehydrogenase [Sphingopyxis sp. YR583]|uniref:Glu/Leu/Phe/Val dehydrogenase family protein n=1 Tax=Sphingopyxis sp. YR583 TaxID=1881047 RepID=UPI0008A8166D|nr:Glu/Leu/Phe/Val dehydrogenase dimerization domain-containing protein [Sphingopyxis sp. YR583]SEH13910.1 leucine dehydrogenase [Sphingopyxis sp. YR583]